MPIQQLATERKIKYLFHFTQVGNLPSILQHGLMPTHLLDGNQIPFIQNDELRLDGTTGICLTIGFPNYKVFYPFRVNTPGTQWAVLAIKANVLWEHECVFSVRNAAHNDVRGIPIPHRQTPQAFQAMFHDFLGVPRATLGIPDHFPTNPQAEVLVLEPIGPEYIAAIIFDNLALKREYATKNLVQQVIHNRAFFTARVDFDKWKGNG